MIHPVKAPRYGTVNLTQEEVQRMKPPMQWAADEIERTLRGRPCGLDWFCWIGLGVAVIYITVRRFVL